jgi:type II secretory ATPase GspE/PulE/Tfp pilus assembly ATPase PilB-like protein
MSDLDIAEKRLPQDGRIKLKLDNQDIDLRISILPSAYGETVDIRLLSSNILLGLESLGLLKEDLVIFEKLIRQPHGIIFVTGPTGSGKTTTLYACLSKINGKEKKIITIEDPIEYVLEGVTQIQVHPKIGLSFASGLRTMLRHDPDIMMVGEVRDLETAEIAIRAALTGHLVFSTLHTNDAAGAITRLIDMGIEPFLVSSSINASIAQRLVRLICPACKQEVKSPREALKELGVKEESFSGTLYEGKGCELCKFTGFRGRTAIYEILVITDPIRELIVNRTPLNVIRKEAIKAGMKTLRQDGWIKIKQGLTTVSEVLRVTQEEEESLE